MSSESIGRTTEKHFTQKRLHIVSDDGIWRSAPRSSIVSTGSGGSGGGDVEIKIAKLETEVSNIKDGLKGVEGSVKTLGDRALIVTGILLAAALAVMMPLYSSMEGKLDKMEGKLDNLDTKIDTKFTEVSNQIDDADRKMDLVLHQLGIQGASKDTVKRSN